MRNIFTMNIQNKLKVGIGVILLLLIILYTYCLYVWGGMYLDGNEYVAQVGIIVVFSIFVILIKKRMLLKNKWMALLLMGAVSIVGVLVISAVLGKTIKYNTEMLIISLWPMICCIIVKYFNMSNKVKFKPFVFDCMSYNKCNVSSETKNVLGKVNEALQKIKALK